MLANPLLIEILRSIGICLNSDSIPALRNKGVAKGDDDWIKSTNLEKVTILNIVEVSHLTVFKVLEVLIVDNNLFVLMRDNEEEAQEEV